MKRTQLQLADATYQQLRQKAFEDGVPMARVIRDALATYLAGEPRQPASIERFSFIASGQSSPSGLDPISERHDEALAEDLAG